MYLWILAAPHAKRSVFDILVETRLTEVNLQELPSWIARNYGLLQAIRGTANHDPKLLGILRVHFHKQFQTVSTDVVQQKLCTGNQVDVFTSAVIQTVSQLIYRNAL